MGTATDTVTIGIVGAGIMGSKHARIYTEIRGARLYGVADINETAASTVASQFGARAFTDYRKMLEVPEVDAIHIATPDHLHTEPVLASLEAGKHVLVEKPMATTVEDARKIVATSKRTGRHVMVNYTHRWAAPYAQTHAMVRSGAIGRPIMVYARKDDAIWAATEMMSWTSRTSSASYLSTHDIDLVLWFLDTDVESVYAMGVKKVLAERGIDTEDAIQALVRFSNGAIGTFESCWVLPNTMPTTTDSFIELVGDKGTIHVDRIHEGLKVATQGKYEFPKLSMSLEIDGRMRGGVPFCLEQFVESLRKGEKPQPDAENGLKIVRISIAIQRSIKEGKLIRIADL
jgi:predicted dehydrogenase